MARSPLQVQVARKPGGEGLPLPDYAGPGASGLDLRAAVSAPLRLAPGERCRVPTGIAIAVPEGFEAQVRPRSGLALRSGVILPNAPGTIDSDFRGEVQVIVMNMGSEVFIIERGDRIAQLVLAPVVRLAWQEVQELPETLRGEGGFGSTGLK